MTQVPDQIHDKHVVLISYRMSLLPPAVGSIVSVSPQVAATRKATMKTKTLAEIAALDSEIALLLASRATASCDGELDMINDAIDAARAARRTIFRTRR